MPATFGNGVPNRGTNERELDQWNQQMRASPIYQQFMVRQGLPTDGRVRLSRNQQEALERELAASGVQVPSGMHIDQGGNLNQKNRLVRNVAIGAGIAGAALTGGAGFGAFGGGGGAGAGAAGAAGASAGAGVGAGLAGAGAGIGTAAGLAGAGAAAGAGMSGLEIVNLISAIVGGAGAAAGGIRNDATTREGIRANERMHGMDDATKRDLARLAALLQESMANPYRHGNAQMQSAAALDRIAHQQPRQGVPATNRYAGIGPARYEPSPELRGSAEALRNQVLSGNGVASSVTSGSGINVMDLLRLMQGGRTAPGGVDTLPRTPSPGETPVPGGGIVTPVGSGGGPSGREVLDLGTPSYLQGNTGINGGAAMTQGGGADDPRWTNGTWGGTDSEDELLGAPSYMPHNNPGMSGPRPRSRPRPRRRPTRYDSALVSRPLMT